VRSHRRPVKKIRSTGPPPFELAPMNTGRPYTNTFVSSSSSRFRTLYFLDWTPRNPSADVSTSIVVQGFSYSHRVPYLPLSQTHRLFVHAPALLHSPRSASHSQSAHSYEKWTKGTSSFDSDPRTYQSEGDSSIRSYDCDSALACQERHGSGSVPFSRE